MKNIIKTSLVIFLTAILLSCQKQEGTNPSVSEDGLYATMDQAGEEALSQINPADFQRLSDMMKSLSDMPEAIEFDNASKIKLTALIASLTKSKGLVIDTDNLIGTITIDGSSGTYTVGTATKLVYKTKDDTYTFTFTFSKGTKEVYLGQFVIEKNAVNVYLIVPKGIEVSVSDNKGIYMGISANNIDCSNMSDDWSGIIAGLPGNVDKLNFSLSGSGFINGKGSYRASWNKISVANCVVEGDGTLYGKAGAFLASGKGSGKIVAGKEGMQIDPASFKFDGNLINKITTGSNSTGSVNVYLNGNATPQMVIGIAEGTVTFEDGSVKPAEEVFNETNFPKTYKSANDLIKNFTEIFGWITESLIVGSSSVR